VRFRALQLAGQTSRGLRVVQFDKAAGQQPE